MAVDLKALGDLYPFEPRRFDRGGGVEMSYLEEGSGEPVVCVHGNPTWSFYFRDVVKALRVGRRVIAPDHVGCGLSDKPGDDRYEYTLERRIDDLEKLLAHCGVAEGTTLILHDWGGAVGMGWAARHPDWIKRIVILNTAAFLLPPGKMFPFLLRLGRANPVGPLMIRGGNAFARVALRLACERRMPPAVARAYVAPYDNWANRIATLRFVQDIPLKPGDRAWDAMKGIEAALPRFANTPLLGCWGMKDFVFDRHFLEEWRRRLPHGEHHEFPGASHYVLEDAGDRIIPMIADFLGRHP